MIDEIKRLYVEEKLFRIAVYVFMIGTLSAAFMLFNTYFHNMFGTKLPDANEFFTDPPATQ